MRCMFNEGNKNVAFSLSNNSSTTLNSNDGQLFCTSANYIQEARGLQCPCDQFLVQSRDSGSFRTHLLRSSTVTFAKGEV